MDALAAKSLLMKKAHVQLPLCVPSRTSFMTERRPDTTNVYNLKDIWRNVGGPFVTLPEHFKQNGYCWTWKNISLWCFSDAHSWSEGYYATEDNWDSKNRSWEAVEYARIKDNPLVDTLIANNAINRLRTLAEGAKAGTDHFFFAVGFKKPHLPFVFPKWIMTRNYPKDNISLPSNPYVHVSSGVPSIAWTKWIETRNYEDIKALNVDGSINATLPDESVENLRRAYYSSVTCVDVQLGRVVNALKSFGLENDIIISLIGDHGFLLGEHGGWGKSFLFELATHAPMMIHIPGVTDNGIVTEQFAEFVDLFPTIVEAAGLDPISMCPEDSSAINVWAEGLSLMPLISDPNTAVKNASFSQQPRGANRMGYSIRTHQFRYTEWLLIPPPTPQNGTMHVVGSYTI